MELQRNAFLCKNPNKKENILNFCAIRPTKKEIFLSMELD